MMQKLLIMVGLIFSAVVLWSIPIAWVEDLAIESEEYEERIAELPDSLDLITMRQRALESLIEEKLLLLYASEQRIDVSEEETEALFIKEFSTMALFQVEGHFDYNKFASLKKSARIQEILSAMHEDIMIEKTRDLVLKKLELNDKELLERFFLENVKIDVSYAQFDLDNVNISPQLTARGARKYFWEHREEFPGEEEFKLGLTFIPYKEFGEEAEDNIDGLYKTTTAFDLLSEQAEGDSVDLSILEVEAARKTETARQSAKTEEQERLAEEEAMRVRKNLEKGLPIRYPQLTTGFITRSSPAGRIPAEIISRGSNFDRGEISQPYEMEDGILLYWLIEKRHQEEVRLEQVKSRVWKAYIRDLDFQENVEEFRRYFYDHLEEFKVPTLIVNRIDLVERLHGREWPLVKNKERIISELEKYLFNEEYLDWAASEHDLKMKKQSIYLEKYPYRDEIDWKIAEMVAEGTVYGIASGEGKEAFFVLSSIYPSYIPEFEDVIESGYFRSEIDNSYDEPVFREYYQNHKEDFSTRDSVALGGVLYELEPDNLKIDRSEIVEYFESNRGKFYHTEVADCRFLLCLDEARATLASNSLRRGIDYQLVSWCFADTNYQIADGIVEYSSIPEKIRRQLRKMPEGSYSEPLETDQGWLIAGKLRGYSEGYYRIEEVWDEIERTIRYFRADSLAYSRAKAVFDSTSSFTDCSRFARADRIFKTDLQDFGCEFPGLGNLERYRFALMRLWWNEKLTQMVKTENGYAVIFMRKKVESRQLSYEESIDEIKGIFAANKKLERGKKYIRSIIEDLKRGSATDSLLYFLGGMKRVSGVSLDSSIPGFDQSAVLIADMAKHEAGYYSPVLKVAEDKLMFYHINKIEKVTEKDFYRQKKEFSQQMEEEDYRNWLENYREGKRVRR